MIVRDCRACPHMRERSFSTYHEPKNYHPIGFKHVYAWCDNRRKKRLSSRKGWDKPARLNPDGERESAQTRCEAYVMRWHTAATGE